MVIPNGKNLQHKIVNECDDAFHFNLDLTLQVHTNSVEKLQELHSLLFLKP